MIVKLLTEHHLAFLSLKGGITGSSESTLVKMPHYWKLHVVAHIFMSLHTSLWRPSRLCNPKLTENANFDVSKETRDPKFGPSFLHFLDLSYTFDNAISTSIP